MDIVDSDLKKFAAAILAGGRAVRYNGTQKGLLEVEPGVSIMAALLEKTASSGVGEVAILANNPAPYASFGVPILPDLRNGIGPIGGIEAGLAHYAGLYQAILFVPCDLPGMTGEVLRELLRVFLASEARVVFAQVRDSFMHPLCAVMRNDALDALVRNIDEGNHKVMDIWRKLGAIPVRFDDPAPFFNVNTPNDMALWRAERTGRDKIMLQVGGWNARPLIAAHGLESH